MSKLLLGIAAGALGVALLGSPTAKLVLSADIPGSLKPYEVTMVNKLIGHTYNIRLGEELGESETLQKVVNTLETAGRFDTVVFHIEGAGGSVDGLLGIINAIHLSKAKVVMSVEGPAYSAYAVLATQGDKLLMSKYALLMFHTSSLVDVDCKAQTGVDRGVSNVEHCDAFYKANMNLWYKLLHSINLLTKDEQKRIESGHDVYLDSDTVNARMK